MAKKILIDVGYAPIFIPGIWTFWSIHIDNPPAINDLGDLLDAEIIFGLGTPLIPFAKPYPINTTLGVSSVVGVCALVVGPTPTTGPNPHVPPTFEFDGSQFSQNGFGYNNGTLAYNTSASSVSVSITNGAISGGQFSLVFAPPPKSTAPAPPPAPQLTFNGDLTHNTADIYLQSQVRNESWGGSWTPKNNWFTGVVNLLRFDPSTAVPLLPINGGEFSM